MAAAVGAFSGSKDIGFSAETDKEELSNNSKIVTEPAEMNLEEEEEEDEDDVKLDLGPQLSLKEQLEKDKDDESLRRWKEQLLGSTDICGESKEADVKVVSLSILCPGRADLVMPLPFAPNSKGTLFSLKEGTRFRLKFSFVVKDNIVSGLKYTNTVWKTAIKVDSTKVMLGTFSPQQDPYSYEFEEETTPAGLFARGSYSARTKFVDDDGKCYLDVRYHFEILKNWPSP